MSNIKRIALGAPFVLLILVGLFSLISPYSGLGAFKQVSQNSWQQGARHLLKKYDAKTDAIFIHPQWDETSLPFLYQDIATSRVTQINPSKEDLSMYKRLWILTPTHLKSSAIQRLPYKAPKVVVQQEMNDITVMRIDLPAPEYKYHFRQNLNLASVSRIQGKKSTACKQWDAKTRTWFCPKRDNMLNVSDTTKELGQDVHECIWAHALGKNKTLQIQYKQVPLDNILRLRAGLTLRAARFNISDATITVKVGETTVHKEVLKNKISAWPTINIDTTKWAGQKKRITFEITSQKKRMRYVCFDAWTRQDTQ